jgi:hypothetical protein
MTDKKDKKIIFHATWYTDDTKLLTCGKNIEAYNMLDAAKILKAEGIVPIYICNKSLIDTINKPSNIV